MQLGEPDASGRRRPVPIPGSEYTIKCDTIIPAYRADAGRSGAAAGLGRGLDEAHDRSRPIPSTS